MATSKVAVMLMLTLCGSAFASRHLTEATEKVLDFSVEVGSGPSAKVRQTYIARDAVGGALFTVAVVESGTVKLAGDSLTVASADGKPITSAFIFKSAADSIASEAWAVNLQAKASAPQSFFVTAAAAHPTNGALYIVGTYAGALTMGATTLTSSGSFDIFVAAVSAKDGSVMWAKSFGGAVGADSAFDLAFHPTTGDMYVSGAFAKMSVFGSSHAVVASVDNAMMPTGVFVAAMSPADGDIAWVSTFPSTAASFATVKLAVSDAVYVGASAAGPFDLFVGSSKVAMPATAAGAVFFSLSALDGKVTSAAPKTVMSASNGVPAFMLGSLSAAKGVLYAAASYVGQLVVDGRASGAPTDGYTNGAVITMDATLASVWTATLAGAGTQTAESVAAEPSNLSVFVSGVATPKGAITVTTPTTQQTYETGADGGYIVQLAGADGAFKWIRTFEGKDNAAEIVYASGETPTLYTSALFDVAQKCMTLNNDESCVSEDDAARPFYVASIPVSAASTGEAEKDLAAAQGGGSSMSSGTIAGIVVGSVAGVALLAAVTFFVVKRRSAAHGDEFSHLPASA